MSTSRIRQQDASDQRERSPIKQRTCIGCRQVTHQHELVRIANTGDGVVVDHGNNLGGRGAWLHARTECIATAKAKSQFARAFKGQVTFSAEFERWHETVRLDGQSPSGYNPNESG